MVEITFSDYPDYFGFWKTPLCEESPFFLWLYPDTPQKDNDEQKGFSLDASGVANIRKWKITPEGNSRKVDFTKQYIEGLSRLARVQSEDSPIPKGFAIPSEINYEGVWKNERFAGKYHDTMPRPIVPRPNGLPLNQNYSGEFAMEPYPRDAPVMDCIVREACRSARENFQNIDTNFRTFYQGRETEIGFNSPIYRIFLLSIANLPNRDKILRGE